MSILSNILFFLITLGIAIIFHEFGHFIVGRWCGVRVERFSVGFGKALFKIKRGDTEYVLAPIPMGGYVKFAGDSMEEELEGKPWEFLSASPWKRIAIVIAGPAMNVVLAFLLYYIVLIGAGEPYIRTTTVGAVLPGFPAAQAGVEPGDKIIAVNGELVAGEEGRWSKVQEAVAGVRTTELDLEIERPGLEKPIHLNVELLPESKLHQPPRVWGTVGNSPAHQAGLQHGDVILSVSGTPIENWDDLTEAIWSKYRMVEKDGQMTVEGVPFPIRWRTPEGEEKEAIVTPDVSARPELATELVTSTGLEPHDVDPDAEPVITGQAYQQAVTAGRNLPERLNAGDRLVSVDGERVNSWAEVQEAVKHDVIRLDDFNFFGAPVSVRWQESASGEILSGSLTVQTAIREVPPERPYHAAIGIFPPYLYAMLQESGILALGVAPDRPLVVDSVTRWSAAQKAGLEHGDTLLELNGVPVESIGEVVGMVMGQFRITPEGRVEPEPIQLTWRSEAGEIVTREVKPDVDKQFVTPDSIKSGRQQYMARLGIQFQTDREYHGLAGSAGVALERVWRDCKLLFLTLQKMISQEWSVRALAGPIGIFTLSGQQGNQGFEQFLIFVAMLSVNLAIVNLLPIPILDGGHLVIYTLEIIRKRQLTRNQLEWAHRIAFFGILLPLIVAVFYIDLERLGLFEAIGRTMRSWLP